MKDENEIREVYRQYLKQEVARPEIACEKKEFIARYFEEQPAAALSPAAFAPALSLIVLLIALIFLQRPVLQTKTLETKPEGAYTLTESVVPFPPSATTASLPSEVPPVGLRDERPAVVVKRISSRAGSTLVYQKSYQGTPITIVWVFVATQ